MDEEHSELQLSILERGVPDARIGEEIHAFVGSSENRTYGIRKERVELNSVLLSLNNYVD